MEKVGGGGESPRGSPSHTLKIAFLVKFLPITYIWYLTGFIICTLSPSYFLSISLLVCCVKDRIVSGDLTFPLPKRCCYGANEVRVPGSVRGWFLTH